MQHPNSSPLWFIRHAPIAEYDAHHAGRYIGGGSDLAAEEISAQIRQQICAQLPADVQLICSPLQRCRQTLEQLMPNAAYSTQAAFAEQSFGQWEGRHYDEVWAETSHDPLWDTPHMLRPPGGESLEDVACRVHVALKTLAPRPTVIVTHAGVIRAAYALLNGKTVQESLEYPVPHLSVHVWCRL